MIKVGITGGIGSGKTTVCNIFETFGIPVYNADDRAKKLMTSNKILKSQISDLLGSDAYFKNGRLNRKHIGNIVFKDKNKLAALNALVHPAVAKDGQAWFEQKKIEGHPYAIKEAALLIESKSYKELDKLIVVTAPLELRIERVMKRDKVPREGVEARIKNQMDEQERLKYADFIIENNDEQSLIGQVNNIHRMLIDLK
jgi:dephospho-CoA kinase